MIQYNSIIYIPKVSYRLLVLVYHPKNFSDPSWPPLKKFVGMPLYPPYAAFTIVYFFFVTYTAAALHVVWK